jgi:hypothetical protein
MRKSLVLGSAAVLLAGGFAVTLVTPWGSSETGSTVSAADCAPGFVSITSVAREVVGEMSNEGEPTAEIAELRELLAGGEAAESRDGEPKGGEAVEELRDELAHELPQSQGIEPGEWDDWCVPRKRPESMSELATMAAERAIPRMAPLAQGYETGAFASAVRARSAMRAGSVRGTSGTGKQYGQGPLIVNDKRFDEVNGLGLVENSGRVDSYAWDPEANRLFAAVGTGGIWYTDDLADKVPAEPTGALQWQDATGNMPTTITGAVEWTPARGGTLLAVTGDPTFGSNAFTGIGAYWSGDLGKHWHRAKGVPDGGLGFQLAVDPAAPRRVYAATQMGLFRSTDGGRSYRNVKLPTGKVEDGGKSCAGVTNYDRRPECALANVVTDVVVTTPGGEGTDTKKHTVVATVGWRGGSRVNMTDDDGSVQSPRNGVYRSATGKRGTFKKLETTGFAPQENIGRVELGAAVGPDQDHDYLYAIVQDAQLLNEGGVAGIDVPDTSEGEDDVTEPVGTTVLNGIYVSDDFGQSWTEMASSTELTTDPTTGSALIGTGTATGYQPGVQAWYNLHVHPDPTKTDPVTHAPTRMVFGLEEIWANETAPTGDGQPLTGPTKFHVVGKYFAGDSCLLLSAGLPACPTDREPTDPDNLTTHPDQHESIWIQDKDVADGAVQLVVGNDGGSYRYRFESDDDQALDNTHWYEGDNAGFTTLLPYFAAVSKDGTVWAGLQDNGNMLVSPKSREQFETYGGDGFYTAVDPDNSDVSYEEYVYGAISVTEDGGRSWRDIDPGLTAGKFANPFAMDPLDADHIVTAGREVVETLNGPGTSAGMGEGTQWRKVYDLGTKTHHGDPDSQSSVDNPNNSMSAVDVVGDAVYVAYCGNCDTLNKKRPEDHVFVNGIATNVGGAEQREPLTSKGWHYFRQPNGEVGKERQLVGLPNRYITSIAADPKKPTRVFATLGGYTRRWLPPGAVGDVNLHIGKGHLFRSNDAGKTWKDVTGNLPDAPATWVEVRGGQLLVGTDVGAFASNLKGTTDRDPRFAPLKDIPAVPISSIQLQPGSNHRAIVATFGRGVWSYDFASSVKPPTPVADPDEEPARVGEAYASYDFENGTQGWTSAPSEDAQGVPVPWTYGAPGEGQDGTSDDQGSAWSVAGPAGYADSQDSVLLSPPVTTDKGAAVIQFGMLLDTEAGFDEVTVQFRPAGGSEGWTSLGSFSGQFPEYPSWATVGLPFDSPGGDLEFRFRFTSDEICSYQPNPLCADTDGKDGARVDNVEVGKPAA